MKRIISLFMTCLLAVSVFTACASNGGETSKDDTSSTGTESAAGSTNSEDPVKLVYVLPGDQPVDYERGIADVNAKLAADGVGVEIELKFYAWDVWDQKINIMLSTGEEFDMFHVMNDRVTIANYASRGALADITEVFNEYGQDIIANCPELAVKSGQVGGKQFAIPAYWVESAINHQGLVRLDLLKKYGIDKVPTTFEELTKAYETVMEKWEGAQKPYLPLAGAKQVGGYMWNSDNDYVLYENMIYVNQDGTIKNFFETDTFKECCENAREWYQKGLINPDVLTITNEQLNNQLSTGDWFVHFGTIGDITPMKDNYPDITVDDFGWLDFDTTKPEIRPYGTRNMQAVPLSSKHPEAAVKFVNWLYSNQENYNLFLYGTEGKDYEMIDDKNYAGIVDETIGKIPYSVSTWMIGNINYGYTNVNAPTETNKHLYILDETAVDGVAAQLTFDGSSVQTQIADVNTQIAAVIAPMACGVVDYESNIDEALDLLKKAGIDDIVAEFQKQLDAIK